MIKFNLTYEYLIERELSDKLTIIKTENLHIIQECINLFNSEIVWDKMFTVNDSIYRIQNGDKLFVGYYDNIIFGYLWLKKYNNIFQIYNVFSKNTTFKREYGATDMLYYVIKNYTSGTIVSEVDEWNIRSINVFNKLGFK